MVQMFDILSGNNTLDRPLQSTDSITIFHNFRDQAQAVDSIQHGISGAEAANRAYSYETDNNPTGLFVSPTLR